jgi:methionyl-tRNA formyltransferase
MLPVPPEGARRIAYLGNPAPAVIPLRRLIEAGYEIPVVVSNSDRRRGRGQRSSPSPVKQAAVDAGLHVIDEVSQLPDYDVDLAVVVAFGQLIRRDLLERLPFVNLHVSLLPRWRGAAPVERAILAGDQLTGVCVMAVEEGLDTGGVYRQATTPVGSKTADELRNELLESGAELLLDCLSNGFGPAHPQQGDASYAAKLTNEERSLDWSGPAVKLDRVVRCGGAWTTVGGARLKVLSAEPLRDADLPPAQLSDDPSRVVVGSGEGSLLLGQVQPAGRGAMSATDWRRGAGAAVTHFDR